MDLRYVQYINLKERYYEPPLEKATEMALEISNVPSNWVINSDKHWTYYSKSDSYLPVQGWKVHISSTPKEAKEMLKVVSNFLFENLVPFKHVSNVWELILKNSKYGDRASSGKFITIYPNNENQFTFLLEKLHLLLNDFSKGPYILNDKRWLDGNVYFRYGAFKEMYLINGASRIPAIQNPLGELIPDSRAPYYTVPDFIEEPLIVKKMSEEHEKIQTAVSELDNYTIESALHFSNGGGVYVANHIPSNTKVVLKEGRPYAGLDGQGRDAVERLNHEASILKKLLGLESVVSFHKTFPEWEHVFLAEEYISGTSLDTWIATNYPFSAQQDSNEYCNNACSILRQLKDALQSIHARDVGMGDLQPANVMVTASNDIKLIDFEAASHINDSIPSGLMRLGFVGAPNLSREQTDWFALLRIARYVFLPIGPVQDIAVNIIKKHDQWIFDQFGSQAMRLIEEIESECNKRSVIPQKSLLSAPSKYFSRLDLPEIISSIRAGIVNDLKCDIKLLSGDIRQYESLGGIFNILTGGFGVIMALMRTGDVPEKAKSWALKYSAEEYINQLDNGLFSGKAGVAGILYELGMIERSKAIYDSIEVESDNADISIRTGLAGIGLAFISASYIPNLKSMLDRAIKIGLQLCSLLEKDIAVTSNDADAIPLGLIDGWSGVSLFYSALFKATNEKVWLELSLQALEKDTSICIMDNSGTYQVNDKENTRFIPYLAGGSAGVGLSMIELRHLLKDPRWETELRGIGEVASSKCFYGSGLFRGLGGMIITANTIDIELQTGGRFLDKTLNTLNLYVLSDNDKYFMPGDYCYKLSGDIFSGAAGMLLALLGIEEDRFSWLPLPKLKETFSSNQNSAKGIAVL
ncbi:class III lanthionine synthetase LanKC [Lysinibacillus sp. NPDC056232]|uniref:class III lanthionine synthetase LanKC n=1 Tax=Lysinibacillus sp. NPDC056232 TaxID=3345756 RepID=UPI0035DB298F